MDDALLDYGGGSIKQGTFYSVERSDYDFTNEIYGNMFACTFVIDSKEDYYERKVYNFFDLTGQIGGLYEIFSIIGGIIVSFLSEKILMLSLMSSLYQVNSKNDSSESHRQYQTVDTFRVAPKVNLEEEKIPDKLIKVENLDESLPDQHDTVSKTSGKLSVLII